MPEAALNKYHRLLALAFAQDALTVGEWDRASVQELIQRTLAPFQEEQFIVQGPEASLDGNNALHLTMALHELATNAVKYGALSNDDGKVNISWSVDARSLVLSWEEKVDRQSWHRSARATARC